MNNSTPPPSRPGKTAPDDRPAINAEWLAHMLEAKPDFLKRLFEVFMNEEPVRLAALVAAVVMSDVEQVRYLAHSLKGAAATMGMERLRDACRELEFAAKDGDSAAISARLVPVTQEMESVFALMRRVMTPV
ncbi:Hpt domain-containing protein [Humidesulfovibrio idahonensis]